MEKITLIATATMGLESIVARELKYLGYGKTTTSDGKVELEGTLQDICTLNLRLRCAERILIKIGEFEATTFDQLFDRTQALNWSKFISRNGQFPISRVTSVKSTLFSKSDCQSIVKKAIVKNLQKSYNLDRLPENGPAYSIQLRILRDIVTISIDTSGEGLHKRGYRTDTNIAPIKETLAAALVLLSDWKGGEKPLLDPTCGSGTILIEAGMIAKNIAPGLKRTFISEKWPLLPGSLWTEEREKALKAQKLEAPCKIYGSDINDKTCRVARENVKNAGLEENVSIQKLPLTEISPPSNNGTIICNPPYGERIQEKQEAESLSIEMGRIFRNTFTNWSYFIITPDTNFEKLFGKKATRNRKLFNGGIKCYYYQYY